MIKLLKKIFALDSQVVKEKEPYVIQNNVKDWVVDPIHTKITFKVLHMGIAEVVGSLKVKEGNIKGTLPHLYDMKVQVKVDAASINTEFEQRDAHLKSPDFLDVEKYPEISFESTQIKWKPLKRFDIEGNLTIKGITRLIKFEGSIVNSINHDLTGEPRLGFKLRGQLNRRDFNVNFDMYIEGGQAIASDIVDFDADVELTTASGLSKLKAFLGLPN
ncbi:MAG: YceI family protein [Bacteroidia bacterium]|nr:YceI family protein [Bacteroidia bacterium]MDW8159713.1 YceI family protein [Bacteroidia bacterium]